MSATVGTEGGVVHVGGSDADYRVVFPEGAVVSDTDVVVTPILGVEGFPLSGGVLGGVQLEPSGLKLLKPVTVEIRLDGPAAAQLEGQVEAGLAVYGFSYVGEGEELAVIPVDVSDDLSVVRVETVSFSGYGAGVGTLRELLGWPPPSPGARNFEHEIGQLIAEDNQRWLEDPNRDESYMGPFDNPELRASISDLMVDWYTAEILPLTTRAMTDPAVFEEALNAAIDWQGDAIRFRFLTRAWGIPTDEFAAHGVVLKGNLSVAMLTALQAANEACRQTGDIDDLARVIAIDRAASQAQLADSRIGQILTPEGFCLELEIRVNAPEALTEGETDRLSFSIHSQAGFVTTDDMVTLDADIKFTPLDRLLLRVQPDVIEADYGMDRGTDITAGSPGNEAQTTTLRLDLTIYGITLATETITINITPGVRPITCTGDPATLTNTDDSPERILIKFDGEACSILTETEGVDYHARDIPETLMSFDTDPGDSGWDDAGVGANWTRETFGEEEPSGTYEVLVDPVDGGMRYTLTFTIEVTRQSGDRVVMTVRNVKIEATPNTGS